MALELDLAKDTVSKALVHEALVVAPETTVRETLGLMQAKRRGSVLVCGGDALEGIFTERDVVALMARGADLDAPVRSVMTSSPVTVTPQTTMAEAISTMSAGGYRRLPVVDGAGCPKGVLKVTGIVHYLVEFVADTVYTLPPEPHPTTREREGA